MTYKVLSLKWRPNSFNDVVGQDHITHTLMNAIKFERIAQAYMFTGPRGVGKTTTARILAMALNSGESPSVDFNPNCNDAVEIAEARSLDVIEIDGASNRGIDEIRNLREQIKFSPMRSKFKIIIIDEVHMLTNQAFNALLRTLEEPPQHGKFIFATTDIHKVPATIISRCQRFDFNNIDIDTILKRLGFILEKEKIKYDKESLRLIANKSSGSMRDALSILDQAISYCGDNLNYNSVSEAIGVVHHELFFQYTESILNMNYNQMVTVLSVFIKTGIPAHDILNDLQIHIRNIIYSKINNPEILSDFNTDTKKLYKQHSEFWNRKDLILISQLLTNLSKQIRKSDNPYLLFEMTSLKILEMDKAIQIQDLLNQIKPILNQDAKENKRVTLNTSRIPIDASATIKPSVKKNNPTSVDKKDLQHKDTVTLDLHTINKNWLKVLEIISDERPSISTILEDYAPSKYNDNTLICRNNSSQKYNGEMIQEGIKLAQKIFSSEFNQNFKIILDNKDQSNSNKDTLEKSESAKNIDDQVFNKVVDLFDGEIIR